MNHASPNASSNNGLDTWAVGQRLGEVDIERHSDLEFNGIIKTTEVNVSIRNLTGSPVSSAIEAKSRSKDRHQVSADLISITASRFVNPCHYHAQCLFTVETQRFTDININTNGTWTLRSEPQGLTM